MMPRQLGVQMLDLEHQLLVTARLARLPLQRADLPFDFANQVGDAQEVLLGVFQPAQGLLLCALNLVIPAACSKTIRRSSGLPEMIWVMFPCAMML